MRIIKYLLTCMLVTKFDWSMSKLNLQYQGVLNLWHFMFGLGLVTHSLSYFQVLFCILHYYSLQLISATLGVLSLFDSEMSNNIIHKSICGLGNKLYSKIKYNLSLHNAVSTSNSNWQPRTTQIQILQIAFVVEQFRRCLTIYMAWVCYLYAQTVNTKGYNFSTRPKIQSSSRIM